MKLLVAILLAVCASLWAIAAEEESVELEAADVKQRLLTARPDLPISRVVKSQLEGYYEVTMQGGMTLYVNDAAEYFFAGDLFFVQTQGFVNATELARVSERRKLLETLDESEMIVFAPPPELARTSITVFTDIDCSYCRKLHQEVPELNRLGIAVRYLAYPRAGIGSESYNKAVSAWCADNPQLALTKAKAGQAIEQATCANPVASQYALGDAFGVTGTPAIVYENGTLQSGYLPADQMAIRLGVN